MSSCSPAILLSLAVLLLRTPAAPAQSAPRDSDAPESASEITLGVESYRAARYADAIAHFRRALELDPGSLTAKTYLATALAQNVVPGLNTPENLQAANAAIAIFQEVLAENPHDVNSIKQIAGIYFSTLRLDDALEWQKKVLAENPRDPEAAYTIGVIDWTEAHKNVVKALAAVGMADDGEGNIQAPPLVLETIRTQNAALVEEALQYLRQALDNRPDYADAMAYLNLVYRRKADIDWQDDEARQSDMDAAQGWAQRSMKTRKADEAKKASEVQQQPN
ncbi:MAG TPA: tetratricopeptide repeat protein [Terracidiphilus sp.]|nr:tetratricopeptide repeat protein [Terracidiphilus sp.]